MSISDEIAAVPSGPCTTAADLIARLVQLPPDTPILVDGYEGGFSPIHATPVVEVQKLRRDEDETFWGDYEHTAEAERQAAMPATHWSLAIVGAQPPVLDGPPIVAMVLSRPPR